jgi:hypothetical protein
MSVTTKKEVNQLKDKAHKDLAHWQSQPSTAENRQEILDIQNYLQELDQCYPQFKAWYQTPKERKSSEIVGAIGALIVFVGLCGVMFPSPNNAPDYAAQRDAQQFKDDLNRARGTY